GLLQRHGRAAPPCLVLRDQDLALHVDHAARQRIRGEAAEDDGVRGTDARAREHRDRQLGNHAHVDRDGRSLLHAEPLQGGRELRDLLLQLGVRDLAALVLRLAFPVIRDLVAAALLDVAVEAVVRDVELAAEEPLRVRRLPFIELRERLEPGQPLAAFTLPERLERLVVDVRLRVRLRGEGFGRRVAPLLEEHRVDRVLLTCVRRHGYAASARRGMGEPIRPIGAAPTGRTARGAMPFTTPAADVYHATAAVTIPSQPPACSHHSVPPCERLKKPITSRISVISSVRNTRNTAPLTRMLQSSMYVLKIANASRNHASAFVRFAPATAEANVFETSASTTKIPRLSQKPPYVENAVAPKTFRLRNSHMPASSCTVPP